ncbi:uncharacterized protein [Rutidosis leptorrhynchoides]|uniref:uncharacterized protein n=1 Tax=Rutidosis leptorrhynchoides TaxID=125765 RepID=UPI003A995106
MRTLNAYDVAGLYSAHGEKHGCKGVLRSIDGQYTRGDHKKPIIMPKAVALYDLWICHAFFGMAGFSNDINVLNQTLIFDEVKKGMAPTAPSEVNGHEYTKGYYVADGIYIDWATLVKGFSCPTDEPRIKFFRSFASA